LLSTIAAVSLLGGETLGAAGPEPVVLRLSDGRFLGLGENGLLAAHTGLPTPSDEFFRTAAAGERSVFSARDGRVLGIYRGVLALSAGPKASAGPSERLKITPGEGHRAAMEAEGQAGPTVDLYRVKEIPAALRSVLAVVVQGVALEELKEREYSKQRTRQRQRYVDLPAPKLGDLKHTHRVRILSTTEQYEIKARLNGNPVLEVGRLPYLSAYGRAETGLLLFAVRARLPLSGQVHYEIPKALSITTRFQATLSLDARGQVGLTKSADQLKFDPPRLLELQAAVDRLDISNDVLNTVRELIEDAINHELNKSEDRLREKANASIAKGMASREFRNPLLRFLSLP
jgi:hypothetical protein